MKNEKMKEILDFFRNNKKKTCIGAGAGVAVIAVCVAVGITLGNGAKTTASNTGTQTQTETTTETAETETTLQMPLEENTVPEVTQLITEYYNAAAAGDMDTINSIVNTYDQETQIYLQKMSEHIEAYQNVVCYTKTGPVDGSYLVYAYYEIKFKDLETAVPGISPYLVYPREDGSLYIYEGDVEDSVNQYLEDISAQDDVIDLMNRVQVVFNEAVMQDDTLNNYLAQLKEDLQVEVGEALAEAETASEEETQPAEAAAEAQTTVTKVEATDVVNVRSSDSEQAERLGKVAVGEVLKLLEKKENGWSKVEYNGKEGYIKSEYLKDVEETQEAQAESSASEAAQTAESSAATTSTSSDLPASGKIKIAQTINIRKACSETADKIGTAFPGETLEIVMQQADGWTRVKYNGETGYVTGNDAILFSGQKKGGIPDMKNDDIELLREVQKNAEMGMHALEVINPKVYDNSMALMLARESFKYGELHDRARAVLFSKNQTPDPVNKVKQLMLTASIHGNTLFNATTSHMAEMLIRGSSMGMTSLWKAMNRNEKADGQALELAGELLDFEENNIRELKRYL